jgi:long-chain fatty acid transport protein
VDISMQVFAPVRSVNPGTGIQEDDSMFYIPSISTSFGCCQGKNGFIGMGVYGTSGMGVDYVGVPGLGSETELSVVKMTATYAYRFGDSGLSIGGGPVVVLSRLRTDMMGSSRDWDTATGIGAIIGVNQRLGRLNLGASYMTEQKMSEFEDYTGPALGPNSIFNDSLNFPEQIAAGVAYNLTDTVELALDYRWLGWGELGVFGSGFPNGFGWDNQHIVKAGLTWVVNDALTLRSGISHGKSPIDSSVTFANALFPAIMETHATVGASYTVNNWTTHVAFVHAFDESRTDSFMAPGTEISMYQNSLTAGLTYRFEVSVFSEEMEVGSQSWPLCF